MLIGNRNSFAIELEPLAPTWERRYLPERAAWARFSLWIDGTNLCRNLLDGSDSVRNGVNVPLAPIADWIVRSWTYLAFEERPGCFPLRSSQYDTVSAWGDAPPPEGLSEDQWFDARELWWSRHFLVAAADGSHLPNVSLVRGADRLFVEWAPVQFAGASAPHFLSERGRQDVGWTEGEDVLVQFVSCVARWLRDGEADDAYSWACRVDPLQDATPTLSETLQAYTGIPTDVLRTWTNSSDDADLRKNLGLGADSDDPGGSVITQVLRDLPPGVSEPVRDQVWRLDRETTSVTEFAEELRTVALDAIRPATDPETSGYLAAQGLRDHLDIDGKPIEDVDEQLREFGVSLIHSEVECAQERMLTGSRYGIGAAVIVNQTPRTATPWGRRFESVRALGHLLMDSYRQGALGAASAPYAQPWTRRRSGAFAAEFLLPSDALLGDARSLDSLALPEKFEQVLDRFGVGATTAAYHLWNRRLLSSSDVRDHLIDRYSGVGR